MANVKNGAGSDGAWHTAAERAIGAARASQEDSVAQLASLVRIPSLTGEEGAAQAHVAKLLTAIGFDVAMADPDLERMFDRFPEVAQYPTHWQHDLILPYDTLPTIEALRASGLETVLNYTERPNVVGTLRGTGGGRSLILNGHTDTVTIEPAGEWMHDPFGAEIIDGTMFGRGTSDMKGGVMAAIMAVAAIRRSGVELAGDVIIEIVVNEEHAGNGTLDLVCRNVTADAAIVLEPTHNRIFTSHPGGLYWQVEVTGVPRSPGARWSGTRLDGVSAIEKLPPVIAALLAVEQSYNDSVIAEPPSGSRPFSLVIGRVEGGHYETVTAGRAILKGGAYFAPQVGHVRDVMRAMSDAVRRANERDPFLARHPARLSFLHHDDSVLQRPEPAIAGVMAAVLADRGGDAGISPGPFCCDMRHLVNQGGIPSIIFGPGSIAEAHKPNERISLAEYLACIEHLIAFICRWCGARAPSAPSPV